ncbi:MULTISPECIES: DUF748 domain-containing protein [Modicisalibacter]|uniref:AsmA family protein n=1 Tax=Modicisalibacter TaxID=574347 RepID=UPI00100A8CCC|nr:MULTISPECIES: DUF748 domain-containing protein [Halomonadaceae]MBZ9559917.1 DUF748 domain-containing protein [Modicisalibacter sp. R2A 31.J]MBZ9575825.1 DUF748 domain-containing protein [Modicisalibacter sp. MOD 31.J]
MAEDDAAQAGARTGKPRSPRRPWTITLVLLAVVAVLLAAGWWALPRLIESRLVAALSATTGREVTIESVEVTPWQARVRLEGLRIAGDDDQPVLASRAVTARIAWASLWHDGWHIERLHFIAPRLRLIWRTDGGWNLARLFGGGGNGADDRQGSGLRIDRVSAERGHFDWINRRLDPLVTLSLDRVSLTASGFDPRNKTPMDLDAKARWAGQPFTARGKLGFAPWQADLELGVEALPLSVLHGYLAYLTRADIRQGTLSSQVQLQAGAASRHGTTLSAQGSLADLDAATPGGQPLGRAARVRLKGLRFTSSDQRLAIASIALERPRLQVTVDESLSTNLSSWLPPDTGGGGNGDGLGVVIARLSVSRGEVALDDRHLAQAVTLDLEALEGDWKDLSNVADGGGALALQGRVDADSPLRIDGTFDPLVKRMQGDMHLHVENLALTTFAPYIRHFGGYHIEQGRLTLDVDYRLESGRLHAENHVVLHRLELGQPVPGATIDLPMKTIVGLLQGGGGVIRLDVPLTLPLDDPSLDVGGVVGQAIREALENLITSPVETLSEMSVGNAEPGGEPAGHDGQASRQGRESEDADGPALYERARTGE